MIIKRNLKLLVLRSLDQDMIEGKGGGVNNGMLPVQGNIFSIKNFSPPLSPYFYLRYASCYLLKNIILPPFPPHV